MRPKETDVARLGDLWIFQAKFEGFLGFLASREIKANFGVGNLWTISSRIVGVFLGVARELATYGAEAGWNLGV